MLFLYREQSVIFIYLYIFWGCGEGEGGAACVRSLLPV